jgi:hypothetical protein
MYPRELFDVPSMTAARLPTLVPPPQMSRRRQLAPSVRPGGGALLIALLVIVAMLPRVAFLARPFESDAGLYIYMGKALATDQTLYHDFYETKLPGVPLMTAGLYRLFGDQWWAYVMLQAIMTLIAAHLLARSAARASRMPTVAVPTFLFALVFLNFSFVAYRGFQLETVQTFLACIAATFGIKSLARNRRRYAFLVGLFAGSAAMIKPTALAVAGAFALTRIIQLKPKWFSDLILLALGTLIVPAAVLAWTWRAGLLSDMPALLREISIYASQTPLMWDDLFKPLVAILVGGFAFVTAAVFRRRAIVEDGECVRATPGCFFFIGTWLVFEALGIFVQRRMYAYHFLPLAAPLALLFGAACRRGRPHWVYAAAFAPILALSITPMRADLKALFTKGQHNLPESDYLLAHAAPSDTVVGDSIERPLMETHLRCGARYAHLFYFASHDDAPLTFGQQFLSDLEARRPIWAVFETNRAAHRQRQCQDLPMLSQRPLRRERFLDMWNQIDAYLLEHYEPAITLDHVTVFRRKPEGKDQR